MGRWRAASMVSGGFAAATTATGMAKNSHRRSPLGPTGTSAARWSHHFFPPPAHSHSALPLDGFACRHILSLCFNAALFYRSSLCNYYIGVSFSMRCCSSSPRYGLLHLLLIHIFLVGRWCLSGAVSQFFCNNHFPFTYAHSIQHSIGIFVYNSPYYTAHQWLWHNYNLQFTYQYVFSVSHLVKLLNQPFEYKMSSWPKNISSSNVSWR